MWVGTLSTLSRLLFLFAARGLNGLSISLSTSTSLNFPWRAPRFPAPLSHPSVYCCTELKDYVLIARRSDALPIRVLSLPRNRRSGTRKRACDSRVSHLARKSSRIVDYGFSKPQEEESSERNFFTFTRNVSLKFPGNA